MMEALTPTSSEHKLLGVLSICILGGILTAGLWPFHPPKNQVTWLRKDNGLQFGDYGSIMSSGPFPELGAPYRTATVEIWLQARLINDTNTVLSFYTPHGPLGFSLHQSRADLVLDSHVLTEQTGEKAIHLSVPGVFRAWPVFITITLTGRETAVYTDGSVVRTFPPLLIPVPTGRLLVADSPLESDSWSGRLRGLAFYRQALTASEVRQHWETWTTHERPVIADGQHCVALYLFNEHTGSVVRNQVPVGVNLSIPDRYGVVDQTMLQPMWEEFYPSWGYWKSVCVNVIGFAPLGFLVCAYLASLSGVRRAGLFTLAFGFSVSVAIELLQAYLPTRHSGTTDIITNTLGTYIGVSVYRWKLTGIVLARLLLRYRAIYPGPAHADARGG